MTERDERLDEPTSDDASEAEEPQPWAKTSASTDSLAAKDDDEDDAA